MHFRLAYGALALLPQLSSAHFLFPHLMLNGVKTGAYEYVREHDNGFQPSWTPEILDSNDIRCNKGSWNHRSQPKTAQVTAGKDVVGFHLHLDFGIYHPGPVTAGPSSHSCFFFSSFLSLSLFVFFFSFSFLFVFPPADHVIV